jgi:hypothetical protein
MPSESQNENDFDKTTGIPGNGVNDGRWRPNGLTAARTI